MWDLAFEVTDIAPGISAPLAVADFVFSFSWWTQNGQIGEFENGTPPGYDREELLTIAFLLAIKDFSSVEKMVECLPPPPMVMMPSANMHNLEGQEESRRRNAKRKRKAVKNSSVGDRPVASDAGLVDEAEEENMFKTQVDGDPGDLDMTEATREAVDSGAEEGETSSGPGHTNSEVGLNNCLYGCWMKNIVKNCFVMKLLN